ncbi:Asp-tRNA(Asn)/Glu-tRNA(Gln) amidotransferase subunit GatB [Candidatus Woesearchaeota archaeon]|nr:MAG: Asp-tRNA(Asn)/Glu-tRNA(Gln) amidotransferase subunit GatB [Candidatus Woesearchaeota archaeon]
MEPDIKIGLEIHVQLNTKTKLFCSCPTSASEPNTAICPICLGHPGSKPVMNSKALEYAAKLALALGCKLAPTVTFSRKTYFYPDLPKNFQITQHELPLGRDGKIALDDKSIVGITRVHLEEDPGALIHKGNHVLIDYNRSGIPLCEIVTTPSINSPSCAREFLKKLNTIISYLDIFDPNNGVIKADANVSIKEKGFVRVEIKNITGFKEIERALTYEIERQKESEVIQETRGWSAERGITYPMRKKETEADYGYIVEPDLPVFTIAEEWIQAIQSEIPELAQERAARWEAELGIDKSDAKIIASNKRVANLFEEVAKTTDPILAARWIRREVLRVLNDKGKDIKETAFDAQHLTELINLLRDKKITNRIGQKITEKLAEKAFSPKAYVEENKLTMVGDEDELESLCKQIIQDNPKAVSDYKSGEKKSLQFLIGQVMRATKGRANAQLTRALLEKLLEN